MLDEFAYVSDLQITGVHDVIDTLLIEAGSVYHCLWSYDEKVYQLVFTVRCITECKIMFHYFALAD